MKLLPVFSPSLSADGAVNINFEVQLLPDDISFCEYGL